jgi:NAD(P)-dependent dehydrogenase (short-subunit alcohol dehydrogenase family)
MANHSKNRICIVAGANRGIGYATALGLARQSFQVVMVCRNMERGERARQKIIHQTDNVHVDLLIADLSSQRSTEQLAQSFLQQYDQLDVLINNQTAIFEQREVSVDGVEMNFALSYLSYFHLTNLLLEALKASPAGRVVNIAAEVHRNAKLNFDDLFFETAYDPLMPYFQAKLGNILFTYELARRLAGTQVTANCLHPGSIDTQALWTVRGIHSRQTGKDLIKDYAPVRPLEAGSETPLYLATSEEVAGTTGSYFIDKQPARSSDESYDREVAGRLWQISAEMTGVMR